MSKYASKAFWVDAFDRAVSTVAQTTVAALTANVTGLLDVDWAQIASIAGLAGAVSVLTSVAFRGRSEAQPDTSASEIAFAEIRDEVLVQISELDENELFADIQAARARAGMRAV